MMKGASSLVILLFVLASCAGSAAARPPRTGSSRGGPASPHATIGDVPPPSLAVTGAGLIAAGSNTPLWGLNGAAELPIASATKMMTALVVLQHVKNLNTVFTQNDWHAETADSQIGLIPGEHMTVHDLLTALLLPSADDAAEDLAYNIGGGSIPRFVAMMNADARALGLDHTHYSTPIGLDSPGNYSSPDDLVRLGGYMMRRWPLFRDTVALASATLTSGRYVRRVTNTDDLVGKVPWIHGIKTGHTHDAGYVLVSEGARDGMALIGSVLGTTSDTKRDASALALLNWGFSEFKLVTPVRTGETFVRPQVPYEVAPAIVVAKRGYQVVVSRGTRVKVIVGNLRSLSGPMAKGAFVGSLSVVVAGRPTVQIPLVLGRRLPGVSILNRAKHLIKRPFTLLVIALLFGGAAVAVADRRRRPGMLAAGHPGER